MRRSMLAGVAVLAALTFAPRAGAAIFTEVGDAGQLPGTAQVPSTPTGDAVLERIIGNIATPTDVDVYLIRIVNPAAFSATTVGQPGSLLDTQLFLFTAAGLGVEANDEAGPVGSGRSTLPAGGATPAAPGLYLLAISAFNNNPVAPGGLLIFPEPSGIGGVVGPTGPGGGEPLSGWTGGGFSFGTYQIALTGAEFPASVTTPVPGPSGLVLLGTGLLGFAASARKRWKRAA